MSRTNRSNVRIGETAPIGSLMQAVLARYGIDVNDPQWAPFMNPQPAPAKVEQARPAQLRQLMLWDDAEAAMTA